MTCRQYIERPVRSGFGGRQFSDVSHLYLYVFHLDIFTVFVTNKNLLPYLTRKLFSHPRGKHHENSAADKAFAFMQPRSGYGFAIRRL